MGQKLAQAKSPKSSDEAGLVLGTLLDRWPAEIADQDCDSCDERRPERPLLGDVPRAERLSPAMWVYGPIVHRDESSMPLQLGRQPTVMGSSQKGRGSPPRPQPAVERRA